MFKFLATVCLYFVISNSICLAQNMGKMPDSPIEGNLWKKIKLDESGNNEILGVSFLKQKTICNSENVFLIKLVNTNSFQVKVVYQLFENGPLQTILLEPYSNLEGSCDLKPELKELMVIKIPNDNKTYFKYVISHISVFQVK
jgi:hypothetical protein